MSPNTKFPIDLSSMEKKYRTIRLLNFYKPKLMSKIRLIIFKVARWYGGKTK